MTAGSSDKSHDAATLAAQRLVARLQNLYAGPRAFPQIISLGEFAIPALEACLLGPSQALYHPRALAADALAAIGGEQALAALIRALDDSVAREPAPQSREAEEVVVSHIAEHLSRHPRPAVIDALLDALQARRYPSLARALGDLGDSRAIPLLVECLHEDPARDAAMTSLRRFGLTATARLRAALAMPHDVHGMEPPTRIDGRAAAATLLGELGDTLSLMRALDDRQRLVRLAAALGLASGVGTVPVRVLQMLLQGLDERDWARAQIIIQALLPLGSSLAGQLDNILADDASDEDAQRRHRRAAVLAGRLGLASAAPKLAALAGGDDPQLRRAALDALTHIASADDSQLARFLCDPDFDIAAHAFDTLNHRHVLGARDVSRWLRQGTWKSPWRRWWRLWQLMTTARRTAPL